MILQYFLSIFGINFFSAPNFTTFKIRIINQQTSECKDSPVVDAQRLDSRVFPLQIKMKGASRIQLKMKIVIVGSKGQLLVGEGTGTICQQILDQTIGFLLFDKGKSKKDIAICNVDLLVSGQPLYKKSSRASSKRKQSIDKHPNESIPNNMVFSDMSYTVEQEDEQDESQNKNEKTEQNYQEESARLRQISSYDNSVKSFNKFHNPNDDEFKLKLRRIQSDRQKNQIRQVSYPVCRQESIKNKASLYKEPEFVEQSQSSQQLMDPELQSQFSQSLPSKPPQQNLQNAVYLTEKIKAKSPTPLFKFPTGYQPQQSSSSDTVSPVQITNLPISEQGQPKLSESQRKREFSSDSVISLEKIRDKLEESEKLMNKLRNYLEGTKQKEPSQTQKDSSLAKWDKITPSNNNPKIRKRQVRVQSMEQYNTENRFIKYSQQFKDKQTKMLKNFRVCKVVAVNRRQNMIQAAVDWLRIGYPILEGFVTFDAAGHRQYFKAHKIRQQSVEIRLPSQDFSYNITVNIKGEGDYQGIIGGQEGQNKVINLMPRESISHDKPKQQKYLFCFDIQSYHSPQKQKQLTPACSDKSFKHNSDMQFRTMQEIIPTDWSIKERVKSIKVQPWGYGQTYIHNNNNLSQKPKQEQKQTQHNQLDQKEPNIQSEKEKNPTNENEKDENTLNAMQEIAYHKSQALRQSNIEISSIEPVSLDKSFEKASVRSKSHSMQKNKKKKKVIKCQIESKSSSDVILPKLKEQKQKTFHDVEQEESLRKPQAKAYYSPSIQAENEYKIHSKRFSIDSFPSCKDSIDATSRKQSDIANNQRYKKAETMSVARMKQIKEINRLRNGNRNNYRFKQQKNSNSQIQKAQPNLKELWERLLIKNKIQQEYKQLPRYSVSQENCQIAYDNDTERQQKQSLMTPPKKKVGTKFKDLSAQKAISRIDSASLWQKQHQKQKKKANQGSNLYGYISGTNEVLKVQQSWQKDAIIEAGRVPSRKMTLEVNNFSITEPHVEIDQDSSRAIGKFVKFSIRDKVTYFTEIIFNGSFNSILWKLSGCIFRQLNGNERLEVQLFSTVENKISLIGKASIRVSKLHFLRNNHIYNGKVELNGLDNGQFTLGFEVEQFYPFEIIREEDQLTITSPSRYKNHRHLPSKNRSLPLNNTKLYPHQLQSIGKNSHKGFPSTSLNKKMVMMGQVLNRQSASPSLNQTLRRPKQSEESARRAAQHRRQPYLSVPFHAKKEQASMPKGIRPRQ